MLNVMNLSKSFGGIHAVQGVGFKINKGEIVSLIGPNGAGKTTCFNLITGFYSPSSGSVRWMGKEIIGLKPYEIAQKGLIRTFQKTNVLKGLSVFENVIHAHYLTDRDSLLSTFLIGKRFSLKSKGILESSRELIELVGLSDRINVQADSLSCGELRLLEVAVALGAKPRLLMLDEPAAGLNTSEANGLAKILKKLPGNWVEAMLLVEHNMGLVMQVSDNIVVMNFGKKLAEGKPEEIQSNKEVLEAYMGAVA